MCHGFQRVDIRCWLVGVGECGEFRHIRRDDVGHGDDVAQGLFGLLSEQGVTGFRVHDRVEDDYRFGDALVTVMLLQCGQPPFDRFDEFGGAEHTDFHRVDDCVVADRIELCDKEVRLHVHDAGHALSVLCEDAGHGRIPEHSLCSECLHISHGACAADGVGAFDGQDPQPRGCVRCAIRLGFQLRKRHHGGGGMRIVVRLLVLRLAHAGHPFASAD